MPAVRSRLRCDLEWRTTLLTLLLLPLLLGLGVWQLQRAGEKRQLATKFAAQQAAQPAALQRLWGSAAAELAYRPVTVQGRFDSDRYLLLDNRLRQGRFGYEVLALFHLSDSPRSVLVNRGWVAGDPARRSLPAIHQPQGERRLQANVYVAPGAPYRLAAPSLEGTWPLVVQQLDMSLLSPLLEQRLDRELFPHSLRLAASDPAGLETGWPLLNISPAKHTAYAVQWFSMAAVLLLIFIARSTNIWQLLRGRDIGEN
jgi:surfeit locus 1 family protein